MKDLLSEIEKVLRVTLQECIQEILNLTVEKKLDKEIKESLATPEVKSSIAENKVVVYATCRDGAVYYKWNNA